MGYKRYGFGSGYFNYSRPVGGTDFSFFSELIFYCGFFCFIYLMAENNIAFSIPIMFMTIAMFSGHWSKYYLQTLFIAALLISLYGVVNLILCEINVSKSKYADVLFSWSYIYYGTLNIATVIFYAERQKRLKSNYSIQPEQSEQPDVERMD